MKSLFSSYRIKNLKLKNRIVMPSLASFLFDENGFATDKLIEHYKCRAAGGAAVIFLEACSVAENGFVSLHQGRIYHDRYIKGLSKIASAIKVEGCVPGFQIHHCGRQTSPKVINSKPVAPSPLFSPNINKEVLPLSILEIQALINKFGEGADRAIAAGFELVEIHGAHGYLINQFLSKFSNIRVDRYGGDINGRTRFAREIVEEVRHRTAGIPISFKISAQEFVQNGLTVAESIDVLKILIRSGVDIVQISAGNDATPEWIVQPMFMNQACLKNSAIAIKKAISIPTMLVGRINDPFVADKIISRGEADLVCMGRALVADPELPNKAKKRDFTGIRPCIGCNKCIYSIFKKDKIECSVNPIFGKELELTIKPNDGSKRVMIVGGGPAGMSAGWNAALRGHDVHLFEKEASLGGQLKLGSMPYFKKDIGRLIKFHIDMINRAGVICHFGTETTLSRLQELDPDIVVVATGSIPKYTDIKGGTKSIVTPIAKAMNGLPAKGTKIIIIGGGSTGCELACHLSTFGAKVIIIEKRTRVCPDLESITRKVMLEKLNQYGVLLMTEIEAHSIKNDGVLVACCDKPKYLNADHVVIAVGNQPANTFYDQIKSLDLKMYKIGDCLSPRGIKEAIYEGTKIGMRL